MRKKNDNNKKTKILGKNADRRADLRSEKLRRVTFFLQKKYIYN